MLKINLSLQPKSLRSSLSSQNILVSKEVESLMLKKKEIIAKLHSLQYRSREINKNKNEIIHIKHILTTIEIDIMKITQSLEQIQAKQTSIQQQKLSLIVETQDKQLQLDWLGRKLIESYRYTISELDQLRLKMIQLEDSLIFKGIEPSFSIRRSIIMFLKDKFLLRQQYKFSIQLEISVLKKSEQFERFMILSIQEQNFPHQKDIIQKITEYAGCLKQAENSIEKILKITVQKKLIEDRELNRLQLTQSITDQRFKLALLQQRIKSVKNRGNQLARKKLQFQKMLEEKYADRKEMELKLQMLKQKNHCLENTTLKNQDLKQQLAQINEAIDYLKQKNQSYLKNKGKNQQKSQLNQTKPQISSPASYISLPFLSESIVKSQLIKTPINKVIDKRSQKKILTLDRTNYKRKIGSPSAWK